MNPIDLWVLGLFQGESGDAAWRVVWAIGLYEFLRLGRLAGDAGYPHQPAHALAPDLAPYMTNPPRESRVIRIAGR